MNIVERIRYRWKYCRDPLPGEVEPVRCGPYSAEVIWASPIMDREHHIILRRFRGLIGYGPGWTLWSAFWNWCLPVVIVLVGVAVLIVYSVTTGVFMRRVLCQ